MRNRFDQQLATLNDMLIEMGALIERAITLATDAIVRQDAGLARLAIALDQDVDQKEKGIETLCLRLLLQQQPVARDLRLISAALKMITDMERIGDQTADISEIALQLSGERYIKEPTRMQQMAIATSKMVTDSIDAFVKKDLLMAESVVRYDNVVDDLFDTIKADLIELIRADGANGGQAMDLLMVAKYFERIGDHATNIAEWVVFSITGKHGEE